MAGNITIVEPQSNFQKVSKDIIFREDVDVLTLGVYVKILALGKKWQLNVNGLSATLAISPDKVRRSFALLEGAGYLRRERVQDARGRFIGWDYFISSVPFTDIAKTPTSVKTECRKTPTSEKRPSILLYNNSSIETIKENRDSKDNDTIPAQRFNFFKSLLSIGVSEEVAAAWIQVRRTARATNTKIAFDAVAKEIGKSGLSADECIRTAVENSWRGFKASWLTERAARPSAAAPRKKTAFEQNLETADALLGTNYHEQIYGNGGPTL